MMSLKDRRAAEKAAKLAEQQRRERARISAEFARAMRGKGRRDAAEHLQADHVDDLALHVIEAMGAVMAGDATDVHVDALAIASNISMLLCERGYGREAMEDVLRGQDAVMGIIARKQRTGRIGVNGQELALLRVLVDTHEQQLRLAPTRAEMREVLAEIKRRQAQGAVLKVVQ